MKLARAIPLIQYEIGITIRRDNPIHRHPAGEYLRETVHGNEGTGPVKLAAQ